MVHCVLYATICQRLFSHSMQSPEDYKDIAICTSLRPDDAWDAVHLDMVPIVGPVVAVVEVDSLMDIVGE